MNLPVVITMSKDSEAACTSALMAATSSGTITTYRHTGQVWNGMLMQHLSQGQMPPAGRQTRLQAYMPTSQAELSLAGTQGLACTALHAWRGACTDSDVEQGKSSLHKAHAAPSLGAQAVESADPALIADMDSSCTQAPPHHRENGNIQLSHSQAAQQPAPPCTPATQWPAAPCTGSLCWCLAPWRSESRPPR